MKYLLLNDTMIGEVPEIEISKEKFDEYKSARKVLSNCLAIEEKYEILLSNYLEFEKQILEEATSYIVRDYLDYSDFFDVRLGLNIRLVNLLTAARLYIDQIAHNVRECLPEITDATILVKDLTTKEYDENYEYRFMEALRNFVQHRGLPVHLTSHHSKLTSPGNDGLFEYSIELATNRSLLKEDGEFKKEVLLESDEMIDLKITTRGYLESISKIHESVRHLIDHSVNSARAQIEDAQKQYAAISNGNTAALMACIYSDDTLRDSVPLTLNWDDVRVKLQKRNRKLINLKKRYATGKTKTRNK